MVRTRVTSSGTRGTYVKVKVCHSPKEAWTRYQTPTGQLTLFIPSLIGTMSNQRILVFLF